METLTVYRKQDVLAWLPMRVRVHRGGYERLTTQSPAELKTRKGAPYVFEVRVLGMKKKLEVKPEPARNRNFEVQIGTEGQGAFGILLGLLVGVFLVVIGFNAPKPMVEMVVAGLLLLPLMLTVLLGQIRMVSKPPQAP